MREIKFRGKTINGDWVYGSLSESKGLKGQPEKGFYISNSVGEPWAYQVRPETVGQYTGIHDNSEDETEVFEGDVVEFFYGSKPYVGEVKFEAGTFILGCNRLPDSYITLLDIIEIDRDYFWIDGIVKGNKYDNPELLKEGE